MRQHSRAAPHRPWSCAGAGRNPHRPRSLFTHDDRLTGVAEWSGGVLADFAVIGGLTTASIDPLRALQTGRSQRPCNCLLDPSFLLWRRFRVDAAEHDARAAIGLDLNVDNHGGLAHRAATGSSHDRRQGRSRTQCRRRWPRAFRHRRASGSHSPRLPSGSIQRWPSRLREEACTAPGRCFVVQQGFDAMQITCGAIAQDPSVQAGGDDCAPSQHEHRDDANRAADRGRWRYISVASNGAGGGAARVCLVMHVGNSCLATGTATGPKHGTKQHTAGLRRNWEVAVPKSTQSPDWRSIAIDPHHAGA